MRRAGRRAFVGSVATASACLIWPGLAQATLVRGLTLRALVQRSHHIVLLEPLESYCSRVELGGRPSIVTDTRARIVDVVAKPVPATPELFVRTLGGRLGKMGEIVHGQAELMSGGLAVAFLKRGAADVHWVIGMAQGHYPLEGASLKQARLTASPHLPTMIDWHESAVRKLAGQTFEAARATVRTFSGG